MTEKKKEFFTQKLIKMKADLIETLNKKYDEVINLGTDGIQDSVDEAYNIYNRSIMLGKVETDALKLRLVEQALVRIQNNTYGVCIECDEVITDKRLEYVPFARYCTDCKSELERKGLVKV